MKNLITIIKINRLPIQNEIFSTLHQFDLAIFFTKIGNRVFEQYWIQSEIRSNQWHISK